MQSEWMNSSDGREKRTKHSRLFLFFVISSEGVAGEASRTSETPLASIIKKSRKMLLSVHGDGKMPRTSSGRRARVAEKVRIVYRN